MNQKIPHERGYALRSVPSHHVEDAEWDSFLQETSLGEFSQGSAWVRCKMTSGWSCLRQVIRCEEKIAGGFHLLWRPNRCLRIGYVSKGPVARQEEPELISALVRLLMDAAHRLQLSVLVVQPPRRSRLLADALCSSGLLPNRMLEIITATLVLDLSIGMAALENHMSRTTRKHLRYALRRGVTVREGKKEELALFWSMMLKTCARQGVSPNPADVSALKELYSATESGTRCRMTFAEHEGKVIGGLFCIGFGDVLTLWKKGSLPEHMPLRPMELLYHEAFAWAHANGYRVCDFGGLNRQLAERLIKGLPLTAEQGRSRDIFNVRFGGVPVLLPDAVLYVPNRLLSLGCRLLTIIPLTRGRLKKAATSIKPG